VVKEEKRVISGYQSMAYQIMRKFRLFKRKGFLTYSKNAIKTITMCQTKPSIVGLFSLK
jgi:hypothetical protein